MDQIDLARTDEIGDIEELMHQDPEACYRVIGAKIRYIRKFLGVTQEELAERMSISRPSIANIEVGRQRIALHQIEEFAKALGTTPRHLMRGIWI